MAWALEEAMPWFGPYEDAMTVQHRSLFHTRIATLLNLGRLSRACGPRRRTRGPRIEFERGLHPPSAWLA